MLPRALQMIVERFAVRGVLVGVVHQIGEEVCDIVARIVASHQPVAREQSPGALHSFPVFLHRVEARRGRLRIERGRHLVGELIQLDWRILAATVDRGKRLAVALDAAPGVHGIPCGGHLTHARKANAPSISTVTNSTNSTIAPVDILAPQIKRGCGPPLDWHLGTGAGSAGSPLAACGSTVPARSASTASRVWRSSPGSAPSALASASRKDGEQETIRARYTVTASVTTWAELFFIFLT